MEKLRREASSALGMGLATFRTGPAEPTIEQVRPGDREPACDDRDHARQLEAPLLGEMAYDQHA